MIGERSRGIGVDGRGDSGELALVQEEIGQRPGKGRDLCWQMETAFAMCRCLRTGQRQDARAQLMAEGVVLEGQNFAGLVDW